MFLKGLIFLAICLTMVNGQDNTTVNATVAASTVSGVTNLTTNATVAASTVSGVTNLTTNATVAATSAATVITTVQTAAPTTCKYVTTCVNNCTLTTAAATTGGTTAAATTGATTANATTGASTAAAATTAAQINCANVNVSSACCSCTTACASSVTMVPGATNMTNPPTQTPPPKTNPPSAPVNAFEKVADSRFPQILLAMYPGTYTPATAAVNSANQSMFFGIVDNLLSKQWASNCQAAMLYYQYLEDRVVQNNDSMVTLTRLLNVLICKQECNFNRLYSTNNIFSLNTTFGNAVIQYLPSKAASQCASTSQFKSLATGVSGLNNTALAANLVGSPNNIQFLTPTQLNTMAKADSAQALNVAKALFTGGIQLSPIMAKSLGQNLPADTNVAQVASIASGLPLTFFTNASANDLVTSVGKMDLNNMDSFRKNYIGSKIAKSNSSATILSFLTNTNDKSMSSSIPTSQFKSLGLNTVAALANISAQNLPGSLLKSLARSQIASSGTLDNVTYSADTYAKLLPGVTPSDIAACSTNSARITTIVNFVQASIAQYINMTSNQRSFFLSQYLSSVNALHGLSNNMTAILSQINTTNAQTLAPIFLEANETVLAAFTKLSTFGNVIAGAATLTASQCCAFSRTGRKLFASYAAPHSFSYTNLALSDLYKLGPCVASVLPDAYFANISASDFVSYYSTLGNAFQPEDSQIAQAQTFVNINTTLTSTDTAVFSTLSDLALFFPWTESTFIKNFSSTSWTTSGASLLATMQSARLPSSNTLCQVGMTNTGSFTTLINNYGSTFVTNYLAANVSKRLNSISCATLTSIGSPAVGSVSAEQLSKLTDFSSCITLLGASANGWSSAQLTQLVTLANNIYNTTLTDTEIVTLNSIVTGFSADKIKALVFTTTSSISTLGALSGWSSAQLTALATPLSNYITNYLSGTITSDFLSLAGNLLCAFTPTQINNIATAELTVSSLSKISISCPNMATWYSKIKGINTRLSSGEYSTLTNSSSSLSELGTVIAGITTDDIKAILPENIGSIATSAWSVMPAAIVNAMSSDQLAGLSVDSVSSLLSNPNAASFSATVTSSLKSFVGLATSGAVFVSVNMISLIVSSMMAIFFFNLQ